MSDKFNLPTSLEDFRSRDSVERDWTILETIKNQRIQCQTEFVKRAHPKINISWPGVLVSVAVVCLLFFAVGLGIVKWEEVKAARELFFP